MSTVRTVLHHYTSGSGLIGIIESQEIWATQIQYLNDSHEFAHAIAEARVVLKERARDRSSPIDARLCRALASALERMAGLKVYVACLSAIEDSLSQWRGYCPPGFGYSVGFFADELRRIAEPQGFQLIECIYAPIRQREIVEAWVDQSLAALRASRPQNEELETYVSKAGELYLPSFVRFAPALKNEAFRSESEWRLVSLVMDQRKVKLRPGKSMLLPYVAVELGTLTEVGLVSNIRVGPTPNMELAVSAATNLFRRARIPNGIAGSLIPYREW